MEPVSKLDPDLPPIFKKIRSHLNKYRPLLIELTWLNTLVIASLLEKDILCDADKEMLNSIPNRFTKNGTFYDLIRDRLVTMEKYEILIQAMKTNSQSGVADCLKLANQEALPAPAEIKFYSQLPPGITQYLLHSRPNSVCVMSTLDISITCNKIEENIDNFPRLIRQGGSGTQFSLIMLNYDRALASLSNNTFKENDLIVVPVHNETHLKNIVSQVVQHVVVKFVVVTSSSYDNSRQILLEADPQWGSDPARIVLYNDTIDSADLTAWHKEKLIQELNEDLQISLDFVTFDQALQGQLLVDIINGKKLHLNELFDDGNAKEISWYVMRTLKTRHMISKRLFKYDDTKSIFLFREIVNGKAPRYRLGLKDEIKKISRNRKIVDDSANQIEQRKLSARFIMLEEQCHFGRICTDDRINGGVPLHLFYHVDKKLQWKYSSRNLAELHGFVNDDQDLQDSLAEHSFLDTVDTASDFKRLVCIFGQSGNGKSALLSAIRVNLINKFPDRVVLLMETKTFLSEIKKTGEVAIALQNLSCRNNLARMVISQKLKSTTITIELLLDGFDQIKVDDICDDLERLSNVSSSYKSIRLWVTSRAYWLKEIEAGLNVFGYELAGFSKQEEDNFLSLYWHRNGVVSDRVFYRLKNRYSTIQEKYAHLSPFPLYCMLIADSCENPCPTPPIRRVINKLFNIYLNEDDSILGEQELIDMHTIVSLEQVFPGHAKLFNISVDMTELIKVGIIDSSCNQGHLIHPTIANYFVAHFAAKLLENGQLDPAKFDFIFSVILSCNELPDGKSYTFNFMNICYFLDLLLRDMTIEVSWDNFDEHISNFQKASVETAHACRNGDYVHILKLLNKTNAFTRNAASVFNEAFLYKTVMKSSIDMIELVVANFKEHGPFTFTQSIHHECLSLAVRRGNLDAVELFVYDYNDFRFEISKEYAMSLLVDCISNTNDKEDCEIEERIKIIETLFELDDMLLATSSQVPVHGRAIHVRFNAYLSSAVAM